MPAILALLNTEATSRPKASSLAAKNNSSTSSSSGSDALRKEAQHTAVTARQITVSMAAYVIIHAAKEYENLSHYHSAAHIVTTHLPPSCREEETLCARLRWGNVVLPACSTQPCRPMIHIVSFSLFSLSSTMPRTCSKTVLAHTLPMTSQVDQIV